MLMTVDQANDDHSVREKFCLVIWIGEEVKIMRRAKVGHNTVVPVIRDCCAPISELLSTLGIGAHCGREECSPDIFDRGICIYKRGSTRGESKNYPR